MSDTLEFEIPVDAPKLPENFMPAALRALDDDPDAESRLILQLRNWSSDGVAFGVVGPDQIANFGFWDGFAKEFTTSNIDDDKPFRLGPPAPKSDQPLVRTLSFTQAELEPTVNNRKAIVIIDYGIAFWNQRFRINPDGRPRFRTMQYLDFDALAPDGTAIGIRTGMLSEADIRGFCTLADTPNGNAKVMTQLGQRFGGSFFGQNPDRDGLWHGSAIADTAGGADGDDPDGYVLYGMELPSTSLRDSGGDTLGAILAAALAASLAMASPVSDEIIIVLAFGFPAGPHDGSHPIARTIDAFLTDCAARSLKVKLLLPAGNHRQDQCVAHLPAVGEDAVPSVIWRIAPDDFSPNTIEFCLTATADPTVVLAAPNGSTISVSLQAGQFATLRYGGRRIGGLHRLPDRAGAIKLRLSLASTGWRPSGRIPVPFGDWRIAVRAAVASDLWILRDDEDRQRDRFAPRRPSRFYDSLYQTHDQYGDWQRDDSAGSVVRRSGTASVMTTAHHPDHIGVQADEKVGPGPVTVAFYSGKPFLGAPNFAIFEPVEDYLAMDRIEAIGNGGPRRFWFSGTSAAAAARARKLL